ncbi:MAG: hypothetical protein CMI54_07195 [Parcubacteria group bacterium]|jgi:hypothetical protein|nr:hypothetical protein [Parcubacteria group bacterium]|tara:strand:+ start:12382 stop:12573 length:192 start_codon:yes stop_codon:yes gene_type:complete
MFSSNGKRKERFFGNSKAGRQNLVLDVYRCLILDMKEEGTFTEDNPIFIRYRELLEKSIQEDR